MNDGGKLRVLWIEDRAAEYAVKLDQLGVRAGSAFAVTVLSRLEDILALRTSAAGSAATPDFDVVLCDFNLIDSQILPADTETAGLKSRAAGFIIGTLLALRDPYRPRGVVPYSQNQEEFGETFRLFRSYLPSSIVVSEAFETDKSQLERTQVLIRAAETFRASLLQLSQTGNAHFSDETVRWLLASREKSELVFPDREIEINYLGGSRKLLLKSLFYQEYCDGFVDGNNVALYQALVGFASNLSFDNADFRQARQLADRYWNRSKSAASLDAYYAPAQVPNDPPNDTRAKWLMTEQGYSSRVRSYAAIDLLIRSYVQTNLVRSAIESMARDQEDEVDLATIGLEESIDPTLSLVGAARTSFFGSCLEELIDYFSRRSSYSVDDLLDRFERLDRKTLNPDAPPTWEQRWVRALDPEPKPGEALHHTGPRGIGKTLGNHITRKMGEPLNESIGPDLLSGLKNAVLAPELMAMARLFALEMIPGGQPWPPFIQQQAAQP